MILLAAFLFWTAAVCFLDVQPIGPNGSKVGFAAINAFFHNLTGVHFDVYVITDWLGLVPIAVCMGFGILGLVQWIKRKKLLAVDTDILALGGYYLLVMAVYILFEYCSINYRPVLIDGFLEKSYPSSTTMLVLCVMPTVMLQMKLRIKNNCLRKCINGVIVTFTVFMVVGRLVSGVHWLSDIIGGVLISLGLVMLYRAAVLRLN